MIRFRANYILQTFIRKELTRRYLTLVFSYRHVTWTNAKFSSKKEPQTVSSIRMKEIARANIRETRKNYPEAFLDQIRKPAIATSPLLSPKSSTPQKATSSRSTLKEDSITTTMATLCIFVTKDARVIRMWIYLLLIPVPQVPATPSTSQEPTMAPSVSSEKDTVASGPSVAPSTSQAPSDLPSTSVSPSGVPSISQAPTGVPSISMRPSVTPSTSQAPSALPSTSASPSVVPSTSQAPTGVPSISMMPSVAPSISQAPSALPSTSVSPSVVPSISQAPSKSPKSKGGKGKSENINIRRARIRAWALIREENCERGGFNQPLLSAAFFLSYCRSFLERQWTVVFDKVRLQFDTANSQNEGSIDPMPQFDTYSSIVAQGCYWCWYFLWSFH